MKAFPCKGYIQTDEGIIGTSDHAGMDLRDYFAAKALGQMALPTKCIGSRWSGNEWLFDDWSIDNCEQFAKLAYQFADAMMKAREK